MVWSIEVNLPLFSFLDCYYGCRHIEKALRHIVRMLTTLTLAFVLTLPHPTDSIRFPTVTFDNLEGRSLTLPADFNGERNVVFVAFLMEQQKDVDTWAPWLKQTLPKYPGSDFYEIPTIQRMVAPMRWVINRGMRGGIPDRAVRERTVTLYIDKGPFKQALGITTESMIQVLLVDKAGRIWWRTTGPYTPAKAAELEKALAGR